MAFKRLDSLLSSRIFLRAVAVGVALLVWFYVAGDQGSEVNKTLRLRVDYRNASPGFSVTHSVRDVQVRIAANRRLFETLELEKLSCEVDLKGLESGKYRLPARVLLPPGVRLVSVSPEQVTVELVRLIEKVLPIRIAWEGAFPDDALIESLTLTPSEVTVRGREDVLSILTEALVTPKAGETIEGAENLLEVKLKTDKGAEVPGGIDLYPREVRLQAVMVKDVERKEVPIVVSVTGTPEIGYRIEETVVIPPAVQIVGASSALEMVESLQTRPVDVSGLAQDKTVEVEPALPAGQRVKLLGPVKVKVSLVVRPIDNGTGFMRLKLPVKLEGKSVYPSWKSVPSSVSVQVGSASGGSSLPTLDDGIVEVYVDVTNLVSKKIVVPVQVRVNSKEIRVLKIEPERVTLHAMNP
jgi:YbbR domain-containing protein